jgi:hypothetical protein
MPAYIIRIALKEGRYILMDYAMRATIHCLVCFRGDAIEAWAFTILQFVDSSIDFFKGDGQVKLRKHRLLGNFIEDGEVDRTVIVEHTIEVWSKNRHVLFPIFLATLPSGIFMAIGTDFLWWAVEPPMRRRMCSHASLGFIAML